MANAIRGPVLQTIGPSSIHEFPIELVRIQVRHGDPRPPCQQEELDPGQAADLRRSSRGDPPRLEELQSDEELGLLNELFLGLPCAQQDIFRQIDMDDAHATTSYLYSAGSASSAYSAYSATSAASPACRCRRKRTARNAAATPRK